MVLRPLTLGRWSSGVVDSGGWERIRVLGWTAAAPAGDTSGDAVGSTRAGLAYRSATRAEEGDGVTGLEVVAAAAVAYLMRKAGRVGERVDEIVDEAVDQRLD